MKQKRKSRFLTFIFSFLPGAAEMYMGFMKNGLTLMLVFFLSFIPAACLSTLGFLILISVVIWFFGFFHARNFAGMTDEEFYAMEDQYIWEEFPSLKGKKFVKGPIRTWIAAILIFLGVAQLWNYLTEAIYRLIPDAYWDIIYPVVDALPQIVIAILFVVLGVYLIVGKKKELSAAPDVVITNIKELPQKTFEPAPEVVKDTAAEKDAETKTETSDSVKEA